MISLSSAGAYLCHRGRLAERGEKSAQSKVFEKKRPDPKLEADYEVPKTLFGIRDLRPGLSISKQNWSDFRVIDIMQWMRNRTKITIGILRGLRENLCQDYSIYFKNLIGDPHALSMH